MHYGEEQSVPSQVAMQHPQRHDAFPRLHQVRRHLKVPVTGPVAEPGSAGMRVGSPEEDEWSDNGATPQHSSKRGAQWQKRQQR